MVRPVRFTALTISLVLVLPALAAQAQPPAEEALTLPDQVSLTNAGSEALKAIAAAVAKGDAVAARAAGGSPAQVVDALREKFKADLKDQPAERLDAMMRRLDAFADTSGGARLEFTEYKRPDWLKGAPDRFESHFRLRRITADGLWQEINLLTSGGEIFGRPYDPVVQAAAERELATNPPPPFTAANHPGMALREGGGVAGAFAAIRTQNSQRILSDPDINRHFDQFADPSGGATFENIGPAENGDGRIVRKGPTGAVEAVLYVYPGPGGGWGLGSPDTLGRPRP